MTPREPAEIVGGTGEDVLNGTAKVVEFSGNDVSDMYIRGAYEALNIAREVNATLVVLKENSPSCGSAAIYNGSFENRKIAGNGVTSALLKRKALRSYRKNKYQIFSWIRICKGRSSALLAYRLIPASARRLFVLCAAIRLDITLFKL